MDDLIEKRVEALEALMAVQRAQSQALVVALASAGVDLSEPELRAGQRHALNAILEATERRNPGKAARLLQIIQEELPSFPSGYD